MERFKRTFSIRKKRDGAGRGDEASTTTPRPNRHWLEDERRVREGTCSFQVKYLGSIEVFESRGIQICEEAVKALRAKKSRSVWSRMSMRKKKSDNELTKSGHHHAVLHVTGDALRVVDDLSKGLLVDQTVDKVSFCAPHRTSERAFAYICRDGTTRRWLCHGFLATKESGERLSHAVGCAFAICLEKKQQRDKERVSVTYNDNGTSFMRVGSFRPATLSERLTDPQSAIIAGRSIRGQETKLCFCTPMRPSLIIEPVPAVNPTEISETSSYAVQRPHAPVDLIERQGSFRGFEKLSETSPFKRNVSLRLSQLPSTLERKSQGLEGTVGGGRGGGKDQGLVGPMDASGNDFAVASGGIGTIMEVEEPSPTHAYSGLSAGMMSLTIKDDGQTRTNLYPSQPHAVAHPNITTAITVHQPPVISGLDANIQYVGTNVTRQGGGVYAASSWNAQAPSVSVPAFNGASVPQQSPQRSEPLSNPWSPPSNLPSASTISTASHHPTSQASPRSPADGMPDAESWLKSTANFIDPFAGVPIPASSFRRNHGARGSMSSSPPTSPLPAVPLQPQQQQPQQLLLLQQKQQQEQLQMNLYQQQQQLVHQQQQQLLQQQQQLHQMQMQLQQQQQNQTPFTQLQLQQQQLLIRNQQMLNQQQQLPVSSVSHTTVPAVRTTNDSSSGSAWATSVPPASGRFEATDPFDSVWAAKAQHATQYSSISSTSQHTALHAVPINQQPAFQVKI